jgi:hypothetical protein
MKIAIAGLMPILLLGGCIAVPVVEPAPVAGYYYYSPPPARFGYRHHGGHYYHRPYRHRW